MLNYNENCLKIINIPQQKLFIKWGTKVYITYMEVNIMTNGNQERLCMEIDEVRGQLEDLMIHKGMVTDEEVVILSQRLDQLIIQYYMKNESETEGQ